MNQSFIVIIPARYASTRFPGKPLAKIQNKAMILHVAEKASTVCQQVYVATDDDRIAKVVSQQGHKVILTGSHHQTGTERCAEAVGQLGELLDSETIVINVQGDEPFLPPQLLTDLANCFTDPACSIATAIHPITHPEAIHNPNRVKVVVDNDHNALYFSRSPIPYPRQGSALSFQHIGVYAFRSQVLTELVKLEPSLLEQAESLEQLRWLEHGYRIRCVKTNYPGFGIDTPEDLIKAEGIIGII